MRACLTTLKAALYPNLFHVTCLTHNCAERVRSYFTHVDNLIARVKSTRRALFTEIGSPPEPTVTRWGTWIASAEYYAENNVQVKEIVNSFSANGILVQKAKKAVNNETILTSLVKIKRDYSVLTTIIKKMENPKYSIHEAHSDINKLDFKDGSASVMPYIAKRMNKNSDVSAIMELNAQWNEWNAQ